MQTKLKRCGTEYCLELPASMLRQIGVETEAATTVSLRVVGQQLIIEKAATASRLSDRFRNFDYEAELAKQSNHEYDWHGDVGREILK